VLAYFNLLTPGIVLNNLVIVPIMSAEFIVGVAHLAFAPLGLGVVTGAAAGLLFDLTRHASALVTSIPLSYVYAPAAPALLIGAYYATLAAWAVWVRRTRPGWWKMAALVLVVAPIGLSGPLRRPTLDAPFLAVLDVGRGS